MDSLAIISVLCWTLCFDTISAVSRPKLWNDVLALNRDIELGQSKDAGTDRDLHQWWDQFKEQKELFDTLFDEKICRAPEALEEILAELVRLHEKMQAAWDSKQDQLKEIKVILYHVNYTDTGLATTGDEVVDGSCKDIAEYVENTNKTAWEEKEELEEHEEELEEMEFRIDTHPCPCVWGEWGEWPSCSTTCEAGKTLRERPVEKAAVNNGTECEGDSLEEKVCNEDVCCPVDCAWGEWEEWGACPSGCDSQKKIRTRREMTAASCGGMQCQGEDFEAMACSREAELATKVTELETALGECQA